MAAKPAGRKAIPDYLGFTFWPGRFAAVYRLPKRARGQARGRSVGRAGRGRGAGVNGAGGGSKGHKAAGRQGPELGNPPGVTGESNVCMSV